MKKAPPLKTAVLLVGPDHTAIGGMETVIRTYVESNWPEFHFEAVASWRSGGVLGSTPCLIGAALILLRRRLERKPSPIVHFHLSHRGSFVREGSLIALARLLSMRVVATVHGSAFVETATRSKLWNRLYRTVLSLPESVALLNALALSTTVNMGISNALILPNPGPIQESTAYRPISGHEQAVVFAGSVGKRKGVDTLLDAWNIVSSTYPDAILHIAGPDSKESLPRAGRNIVFHGALRADEIYELINSSLLCTLPSTAEAMPMFVLESMGLGRPVVVTPIGAMPAMIAGAGIVVPVGNANELAQAVIDYLEDPELARLQGAAARKAYLLTQNNLYIRKRLRAFYGEDQAIEN